MASSPRTHAVAVGGGRVMTVDDVGDPSGFPVLYFHGTPDSRLARHPDDGLAASAGVRLLAVDRPGYGGSSPLPSPLTPPPAATRISTPVPSPVVQNPRDADASSMGAPDPGGTDASSMGAPDPGDADVASRVVPDPGGIENSNPRPPPPGAPDPSGTDAWSPGWPRALAADVSAVLDALGVERCAVLAWSGGALAGVSVAALLPARVTALGIVAGLVPRQAYDDPAVRAATDGSRLGVIDLADTLPPGALAADVAPLLAPFPCDLALAAEHQAEHRSPVDVAELATVPGGADTMAAALAEAVRPGLAGVAADVESQARRLAADLAAVICPVHLWYGSADTVAPSANGQWYAAHLPGASLTIVDGAGHYLAFTRWSEMLATLASPSAPAMT